MLQGGEDGYYTVEKMTAIIRSIKEEFPDCAVTLSIGERSYREYKAFTMPVRTAICCAMKLLMKLILPDCILTGCP